jgi:hypothetical protein
MHALEDSEELALPEIMDANRPHMPLILAGSGTLFFMCGLLMFFASLHLR